ADIDIVAHDDTCEPGKTYRYRISYELRNPLFNMPGLVKNAAMAGQFSLPSQYSEWTKSVAVPAMVNFFVNAGVSKSAPDASFKIYKWENGQTNQVVQRAAPGDVVGKPDKEKGIDYSTGWSLVDIRDGYIIVADPNGNLVRRDSKTDAADPANKRLDDES